MAVYKETGTNTWRVIYRYTDWTGERKQSSKRGFATKRDAQAWEREQLQKEQSDLDNEMMNQRGKGGKPFSATYLKTLHNQVSAIFNHAVRFYDLKGTATFLT